MKTKKEKITKIPRFYTTQTLIVILFYILKLLYF